MSFHTTTCMINEIITAEGKLAEQINELSTLSYAKRKDNPQALQIVQDMKNRWQVGTKIERLATLGWMEYESLQLFCSIIDNLEQLKKEYNDQVRQYGKPPPLREQNIDDYEKESTIQRKLAQKR